MPAPEYIDVKRPFIQQLEKIGWEYVKGFVDDLAATGRDGQAWPDVERLFQTINTQTLILQSGLVGSQSEACRSTGEGSKNRNQTHAQRSWICRMISTTLPAHAIGEL